MFAEIREFIITIPKLPETSKRFEKTVVPEITTELSRDEIVKEVISKSKVSEMCMLTLYAFRQMDQLDWLPFIKASMERNPVCLVDINGKDIKSVYETVLNLPNESIYDGKRLALPDEVWNFGRGDGIEKAFLMAVYIKMKESPEQILIEVHGKDVIVSCNDHDYHFISGKGLHKRIEINGTSYISG